MFVYVLSSLPVQDELCFVGNTDNMILHGMAQESSTKKKKTELAKWKNKRKPVFLNEMGCNKTAAKHCGCKHCRERLSSSLMQIFVLKLQQAAGRRLRSVPASCKS